MNHSKVTPSSTTLQLYNTPDGIELFIDRGSGESFASQSGLARMCNKGESTIRAWKTSQNIETKDAQIPTSTGLKTAQLYNEKAIRLALKKYNLDLYDKCAEAGVRVMLHGLAGFKVQSTAVQSVGDPMTEFYAMLAESRKQTEAMLARVAALQGQTSATVQEHGSRLETHNARLNRIECEQSRWNSPSGEYMSILAYWKWRDAKLLDKESATLGKLTTSICHQRHIEIKKIKDPRWGRVNAYPENVLAEVFEQWRCR